MGLSAHRGPLAHRDHRGHKESVVSRVRLVLLVPLALLGWTVLSVLVGTLVGKAIRAHLEPSDLEGPPDPLVMLDPADFPVWEEPPEPPVYRANLERQGLWDQQVVSDHLGLWVNPVHPVRHRLA